MAALLDGIRNTVTAHVTRAVTNGLQKVAGNLLGGLAGGPSNPASAIGAINKKSKYTTKNLTYPLNVDDPSGSGHYIIFRINVQNKAQLKRTNEAKNSMKNFESKLATELKLLDADIAEWGMDEGVTRASRVKLVKTDLQAKLGIKNFDKTKARAEAGAGKQTKNNGAEDSIQLKKETTSRIDTAIALYMPPSINVGYGANYGDTEIGVTAETGANVIKEAMGGNYGGAAEAFLEGIETGATKLLTNALDTVAPGAKALIAIERGRVITPRMEIMFQSMGRR